MNKSLTAIGPKYGIDNNLLFSLENVKVLKKKMLEKQIPEFLELEKENNALPKNERPINGYWERFREIMKKYNIKSK